MVQTMTSTVFNPFLWTFRRQFLLGAVACFALIGFAVFSQLQWGLEPCPLCIFQRIAFAALGLVLLVGGVHAPRARAGRWIYGLLGWIAAGVGIGIAARHLWLQLNPPPVPACGPPLDFLRDTLSTGNLIRQVLRGTGDCGTVDWTFLGLSMPGWSLVWFILIFVWIGYAAFLRRR